MRSHVADGHDPPVAVAVFLLACDPVLGGLICEGKSRFLSAMPRLSISSASLLGLRRVDAMQAYTLPTDLESVAVDDADLAGDVLGMGGGDGERESYGEDDTKHCQ